MPSLRNSQVCDRKSCQMMTILDKTAKQGSTYWCSPTKILKSQKLIIFSKRRLGEMAEFMFDDFGFGAEADQPFRQKSDCALQAGG